MNDRPSAHPTGVTRLSGITPSGQVQLGNYLGAIRRWARDNTSGDLYFVSDLHAMTVPHNPAKLRALTRQQLAVLVAAGLPTEALFVQSDLVRELGALTWLLECTCSYGEASRMTQFKEKSNSSTGFRLGLLTYPVLMAADILAQGATEVPVGDDQRQHVELARALARRFNGAYGEVFVIPEATLPPNGARIRDLAEPSRKMSKSAADTSGILSVLDSPDLLRRKISRAVTDNMSRVEYRPDEQRGVANLLDILAACTGTCATDAARDIESYAELKGAVADAVVETLRPVRERTEEILADPAELDRLRAAGAERARQRCAHRLNSALRLAGVG
ncbi:tryptophanyl-tRNA synthetase [Tamaricihabitans halophyticus]|uniref:Tryptophan--tRNA ligase n=1 Tax=Tamaricihabitans halophyticus TaxID=1262583 RepID=A0A4R2R0S5_9PSEU|nr:tryptophan--tRNA ligase [Tamaricihabitans halophyticus]TCP56252.1 tryptophanyl-tRNA synthetase [Tamaricihabitans halophyticus]